jgi:hypothetical protein
MLILTVFRGAILCIGGPALVWYVTPTEEEIFKVRLFLATRACSSVLHPSQRYNPELQAKSLAGREQRQKDFDAFVGQLKEASRSDKPSKFSSATWLKRFANIRSLDRTEGDGCEEVRGGAAGPQR